MSIRPLALLIAFAALTLNGAEKPRVKFTTSAGEFTLELEPEAAPKTVENFLRYVRSGHYKGTIFHRVIRNFMVQGGGHLPDMREKATRPGIPNEAKQALEKGLKNVKGSVAMARMQEPHSASAQFFVNTVDNAFLDFPGQDGWGYCVFGRVSEGMETIERIREAPTQAGNRPVQDIVITAASVVGDKVPAKGKAKKKK